MYGFLRAAMIPATTLAWILVVAGCGVVDSAGEGVNVPPVVDAGRQTADENTEVLLRSSVSDDFERIQTYQWEQLSGPAVALMDTDKEVARFVAPGLTVQESPLEFSFRLTVTDNFNESGSGVVTVLVQAVNALPLAVNDIGDVREGGDASVAVLGNDSDADGEIDESTLAVATVPAHGSAVANPDGTVSYTHDGSETLEDRFTYTVQDNETGTSLPGEVLIRVEPVNDAPLAVEDLAETNEDQPLPINVLGNDTDVDSAIAPETLAVSRRPAHGAAVLADGGITYSPSPNFFGEDAFTYTVSDLEGATSEPGEVTVTVRPVNDPPVAVADSASTTEDEPVDIKVLNNDSDPDSAIDPGSVKIDKPPANGSVIVRSTGVVNYTPKKDFFGDDSFTYSIKDVEGLASGPATVTVAVKEVNSPPTAVDDQATVEEDNSVTIDVVFNDTDVDGNLNRGSAALASQPAHGSAVLVGGKVKYTPDANFNGQDSFTYTVADTRGRRSSPATVTIQVTPVNDPPVAVNDTASASSGFLSSETPVRVLDNDQDPEGNADIVGIRIASAAQHGTARVEVRDGRQVLLYQPTINFQGQDSVTYNAVDRANSVSATVATVTFNVSAFGLRGDGLSASLADSCQVVARQGEVFEGSLRQPSDPDDAQYEVQSDGEKGTAVVVDRYSGAFTYTPNETGARGRDSFSYTVENADSGTEVRTAEVLIQQHVMALGDGITLGRTAWVTGPGAEVNWTGYRKALQDSLRGAGYAVDFVGSLASGGSVEDFDPDHEGHDGFTPYQIAYGTGNGGIFSWLDENPADVVLLHAGTIELSESVAGVASILDEIDRWERSARGNPVTVYVAQIIDQDPPHPDTGAFNANLADLVARRTQDPLHPAYPDNIRLVDLNSLLTYPGDIADGIFPTAQGYTRMAQGWSQALSAIGGSLASCR